MKKLNDQLRHSYDAMYWPILSSSLGRPYVRIMVVNHLEMMREMIVGFQGQDQHSFNPLCSIKAYQSSFGRPWDSKGGFLLRHWEVAIRTDLNLEFTKRILQAKESQKASDKTSPKNNYSAESSICFDEAWNYDRNVDGTLSISLNGVPSLAQFYGNLPFRYTLANSHRSQPK